MRVLIVNVSKGYYNLGVHKLRDYMAAQGHDVTCHDGDPGLFAQGFNLVCLSVIFSWHAPIARDIALRVKGDSDVWCGGPGIFALASWWKKTTGWECQRGLDVRFDKQRGSYRMTFASRGCPVNCSFCVVPRIESTTFALDWDFCPSPILCDNNLSALPVDFQEHILRRYGETHIRLVDANSGFEPLTFDEGTYRRWKPILSGPWRFAFDTLSESPQVERMMSILKEESPRRKRVYVLIGNEPIAQCYERAQKVIEWGGEPCVQPMIPLNALRRDDLKIAYDWDFQNLKDFQRYYYRYLWRSDIPIWQYSNRQGEKPLIQKIHLARA